MSGEQLLLGSRYADDGRPTLPLNRLQRASKEQIEAKIAAGTYRFVAVACCLCGGNRFLPIAAKDRYGLSMPVAVCRGCGLVQTNPRMCAESYAEFYDVEYRRLYGGDDSLRYLESFFVHQVRHGRRIVRELSRTLPAGARLGRGSLVVEVGTGAGGILRAFRDLGCEVRGVDLGREYVEYGSDRDGLDLRVGTLADVERDLRRLGRRADVVVYSHVFEHLLDPAAELAALGRVLADDGLLYVELPGVKNLLRSYRMDFLRLLQNAHTYHFSLATLGGLLARHGFALLRGDESIRAVFAPAAPRQVPVDDFAAIVGYLQRVERWRRILPLAPEDLQPRSIAVAMLRATRLHGPVQAAWRSLRARRGS